jgi:hypothetical protein
MLSIPSFLPGEKTRALLRLKDETAGPKCVKRRRTGKALQRIGGDSSAGSPLRAIVAERCLLESFASGFCKIPGEENQGNCERNGLRKKFNFEEICDCGDQGKNPVKRNPSLVSGFDSSTEEQGDFKRNGEKIYVAPFLVKTGWGLRNKLKASSAAPLFGRRIAPRITA